MIDPVALVLVCAIIVIAALVWDNRHYLQTLDDDD